MTEQYIDIFNKGSAIRTEVIQAQSDFHEAFRSGRCLAPDRAVDRTSWDTFLRAKVASSFSRRARTNLDFAAAPRDLTAVVSGRVTSPMWRRWVVAAPFEKECARTATSVRRQLSDLDELIGLQLYEGTTRSTRLTLAARCRNGHVARVEILLRRSEVEIGKQNDVVSAPDPTRIPCPR